MAAGVRGITVRHLGISEGLGVQCRCGHRQVFDRAMLVATVGASCELNTLYRRLRCGLCDGRPRDIWVTLPHLLRSRG